ncbi:MAG: phage portal protein [Halorhodospira sp.]
MSRQAAYEAAGNGRTLHLWQPPELGPNAALAFSLPTLRRRSRDQIRQNAYAARAADAFVSNLVGSGIRPLPKASAETFRLQLQQLWNDWVEEADAAGELDYYGLQAQIVRSWFEGGECFVRRRLRRERDGLSVPLQLQVLEAEHLPTDMHDYAANGNVIRYGIEFDAIGRRVAYHFYRNHPGEFDRYPGGGQLTSRVPAEEVLHIYLPTRPGQKRGEPLLTQALLTLRDLDEWNDAELKRQKAGSMFLGVIRKVSEEGPEVGSQDTEAEAESEEGVGVQTMESMSFTELSPGEDVNWSDPPEVGNNYTDFLRHRLRAVAQSAGVLYEQLTGDYAEINDRTYRAAHNELTRQVEALQQSVVIPQLCRPSWRWFYAVARATGRLQRPGAISEREGRRVTWVPHAFRHIHPLQDVQADRARVRSGFKSRREVAMENGEDVEALDEDLRRDNERADELGLALDTDPRKTSQAGATQARPQDNRIPPTDPEADGERNEEGEPNE